MSQGRPDLFRRDFLKIFRVMIWITVPVVIIAFFARGYLARLIFSRDAGEIALIFGYLTVAIFFGTMYTFISRWFYAQKDTRTPLLISLLSIVLDIVLLNVLARPGSYNIAGLAMTQSIVSFVEIVILMSVMYYRDRKLFDREFWGACARIVSVGGFSLLTGYTILSFLPLGANDRGIITLGGKLIFICAAVLVVHVSLSSLFGLEEVRPLIDRLKRIVIKPVQIDL